MTFEEYKALHKVDNTIRYCRFSITIPDSAVAIEEPRGADIDGDVIGDKFVCFAYDEWWAWPLKFYGLAKRVRDQTMFNLAARTPYDKTVRDWSNSETMVMLFWALAFVLKPSRETPLIAAVADPDILKGLPIPESVVTVGDFIDYVENINQPAEQKESQ